MQKTLNAIREAALPVGARLGLGLFLSSVRLHQHAARYPLCLV